MAIETATETVGVAVRTPGGVQAELALTGRRRHVETLTPALEHLLAQVDLAPADLGVVAVDLGPGLFTGLRVGVAAAKGLAQSLGIGVVGATSLDILTAGAAGAGRRGLVLACVDARRGEVFAAVHEVDVAGAVPAEPVADRACSRPGTWWRRSARSAESRCCAVGDGALRYADVLGAVPGVEVVTRARPTRPRPRCSTSRWRASTRENRQSSRRASFPSTCARRTQGATSPERSGREPDRR